MPRQRILLAVIVMTALAVAHAGDAGGQTPGTVSPRRGGLVPQRSAPATVEPMSREELMRRFDLNGDSRIDEGEAEIARSRMRQQRADILRNSSVDPLTGRPRGAAPPEPPAKPVDPTAVEAGANPVPRAQAHPPGSEELLLVPGRPDGTAAGRDPKAAAQASPAPQRPAAMTGGVRAGAPPVRAGYGALGPKADLNAGRPMGGPGAAPSGRPSGMQGGMQGMQPPLRGLPPQNAARPPRQAGQPGSGGMPMSGGMPGRSAPGRGTAPPRPGLFPQSSPRVSAEDIGQ